MEVGIAKFISRNYLLIKGIYHKIIIYYLPLVTTMTVVSSTMDFIILRMKQKSVSIIIIFITGEFRLKGL